MTNPAMKPVTDLPPKPSLIQREEREVGDNRMSFTLQDVYDRPYLKLNKKSIIN